MREDEYITRERVIELYFAAAAQGQTTADFVEKPGCVDGAIGAAVNGSLYQEGHPNPLIVAAFLLRSLVGDHCFLDGNKRTAWLAALEVLAVGAHVTISAGHVEAAEFVNDIAAGKIRQIKDIASWLAERLVPFQ